MAKIRRGYERYTKFVVERRHQRKHIRTSKRGRKFYAGRAATLSHLKKDRQTWLKLSAEAKQEAKSDEHLIRKLEKK